MYRRVIASFLDFLLLLELVFNNFKQDSNVLDEVIVCLIIHLAWKTSCNELYYTFKLQNLFVYGLYRM